MHCVFVCCHQRMLIRPLPLLPCSAVVCVNSFNITDRFVHDISVTGTEHGSVVFNGVGYDINLDHHKMSPYQNLFTNIDVGLGTRVFDGSGDATYGSHSAYFSTFHNVQADMRYPLPTPIFGPNLTFIG